MNTEINTSDPSRSDDAVTRRDFLMVSAAAFTAVGAAFALWPVVDSMNPSADTLALSTIEIDLAPTALGQRITVLWRGKPVFIAHRPPDQIAAAERDNDAPNLLDPATDQSRIKRQNG